MKEIIKILLAYGAKCDFPEGCDMYISREISANEIKDLLKICAS